MKTKDSLLDGPAIFRSQEKDPGKQPINERKIRRTKNPRSHVKKAFQGENDQPGQMLPRCHLR